MAVAAILAVAFAPAAGIAQQDYTGRGLAVYAPRPVPALHGPAAAAAPPSTAPASAPAREKMAEVQERAKALLAQGLPRRLTIRNTNTGEQVTAIIWASGAYDSWELARIAQLLRDHHERETVAIDWRLADLLWVLTRLTGAESIDVHSGYRSERTNMHLASTTSGVASDSLHKVGKALDISIPGVPSRRVASLAAALSWGGVGFYGDAGHVHVDVGVPRTWGP